MPSLETNFDVFCAVCGAGLCNNAEVTYPIQKQPRIDITPCENCLDDAREEGREEGKAQASS